jgi:UDP-glucose 4-epimerase/UDP-glucuronate decarboxylase
MVERRILITGGAGFIGYHLACRLAEEPGSKITLLDNLSRGRLDQDMERLLSSENVRLIEGDLTDRETCSRLNHYFEEVYHLAGMIGVRNVMERPHDVLRTNAVAILNLLDWFTRGGGKKILFSSTSEVYAWTHQFHALPFPTPEEVPLALTDLTHPRSTYAESKIFGELAVNQYCRMLNRPFTIVRYHNIYGPRMGNDHVIPQLCRRALDGQTPLVVYSAEHRRAFCYVSDAVEATVRAMREMAADGVTVNIGNDLEEISIGELARRLLDTLGIQVKLAPQPDVSDPIPRRCPDISRARKLLSYQPRVPLAEGLQLTLNWYRNR